MALLPSTSREEWNTACGNGEVAPTRDLRPASVDPRATDVEVTDELSVALADGRRAIVALARFPCLLHARAEQRSNWRPLGDGEDIHWPEVDEDLGVPGLLRGSAAPGASRRAV